MQFLHPIKKHINLFLFFLIMIPLIVIMFFFIAQKQGFHEDEIFSYGSSNYAEDNVFQPYGLHDSFNEAVKQKILGNNPAKTISNIFYYLKHYDEFSNYVLYLTDTRSPVWKTSLQAEQYVTAQSNASLDYTMVYYNQSRDEHPPLFYIFVHTVSFIFSNTFSKYIIFSINLAFFIMTCFVIRNILKVLERNYLTPFALLLYGLSMGGISSVLYQRMYMMLTFFVLYYLYINIKILKNNYKITKRLKAELGVVTLLGFLTQYYFCIYALIITIINTIYMLKKNLTAGTKSYLSYQLKIAIIGIILFPASIYQIFFSYRGIAGIEPAGSYFQNLIAYIEVIFKAFSLPNVAWYAALAVAAALLAINYIKADRKNIISLFIIPAVLYLLIITKITPFIELRYVMCLLPIMSIGALLGIDGIIKNKIIAASVTAAIVAAVSIHGFAVSKPDFLYSDYINNINMAKENKDIPFVYVGDTMFNHISSIPEFMIYDKTLLLGDNELDRLKGDSTIENSNVFILSIKSYKNTDAILHTVLDYTHYTKYELLLNDSGFGNIEYKLKK